MNNPSVAKSPSSFVLEIMDTTLRDGEQTSGVSFAAQEKLSVALLLLEELKVNRIEVASARVSEGELDAVQKIVRWADKRGFLQKIEVLGFVDGGATLDWMRQSGCRVLNLLTKGSLKHCEGQLRKTPEEHWSDIRQTVEAAKQEGLTVNIYLEDWSNGMINSPEYTLRMVETLQDLPIARFMLPDTLGVLNPENTYVYCRKMIEDFPQLHFDFHAHNDYGLAVGNSYAAVRAGVKGLHVTVNGLGERAGNAPLSSILPMLRDQLKIQTTADETKITHLSRVLESYTGLRVPANMPVIGENVFTQTAGIHADGDNKNNLYYNDLLPERFGRMRQYALGKTSGKSNIQKNLEQLGIELDAESMRAVTQRIIELGDKKEKVTQEELPYIVSDVLKSNEGAAIRLVNYSLSLAQGLLPVANLQIEINGKIYADSSTGEGQYDAFVRTLRKIYKEQLHRSFPLLINYSVDIPPGGRTEAFVQTIITWEFDNETLKTRGFDSDQTVAAIKATLKMLNRVESKY